MSPIRILYLAHYIREMDWKLLAKFMRHARASNQHSYLKQALLIIRASLKHNISPLEFYQFGFLAQGETDRTEWAGTGTMYEFQLQANPIECREILNDKRTFYKAYRPFFRHKVYSLDELSSDQTLAARLVSENERLVFKEATGQCGSGVVIRHCADIDMRLLINWMRRRRLDLVETYVEQHPDLDALSPSAVNTVRIFTLITREGQYRNLGCRLRISVDSAVDNLAAGNLAAPIDQKTGKVNGPGVYSDITKAAEESHPVTGTKIVGFQIPYWEETLDLVHRASLLQPQNRSIGWDVVITPEGPGLIEGNHDWCKLVWQLPVRQGLKRRIMENGRYA